MSIYDTSPEEYVKCFFFYNVILKSHPFINFVVCVCVCVCVYFLIQTINITMISFRLHMGKSTTVLLKQHLRMEELKSLVVQIVCECFYLKIKLY